MLLQCACVRRMSFALGLSAVALALVTRANKAAAPTQVEHVELRGRIVCLPEAMHQLYQTELPAEHEHIYGFQASDGSFYTLLRTRYSESLFYDARVREKELLLKGCVLPKSHIFDVERTRSVLNGVVQDLYYYCTVCSIETVSPGPCACCQGSVELKERPLPKARPQ